MQLTHKAILYLLTFLFVPNNLMAQSNDYAIVAFSIQNQDDLGSLFELGLDLECSHHIHTNRFELPIHHSMLSALENSQLTYEIVVPDYQMHYQQQLEKYAFENANALKSANTADHFGYGSMGGFYTLEEVESKLDSMAILFPELATPKFSIGQSEEGRDIWAVKISDNPNVFEEEAVVYYDALHHSREPLSMAVCINFMYYLLENYESDPIVQFIVDNRGLYFVPVVNPDGYEYNRAIAPDGGGLWRKNRKDNETGGDCYGVDLNRNYAFKYDNDANCSSNDPCGQTYSGIGAFSELETQAVRDLLAQIQPQTAFSMHSTFGTYLMPYGYNTSPPDYPIYSEWASDFLNENDYSYGVTFEIIGYTSCGTTRDYMQSENIYGWTPEIDGSGFWPMPYEIFDLVDENIRPLLYNAWVAGGYADLQSHKVLSDVLPDSSFQLMVEVKNKGVGETAKNVTVELEFPYPEITYSGMAELGNIIARSKVDNADSPFEIYIADNFDLTTITELPITIIVKQEGVVNNSETVLVSVGASQNYFSDDAENGGVYWVSDGNGKNWGVVSDDAYSGTHCYGDSDGGNSLNYTQNYFTLESLFNLSETTYPTLEFMYKHSLDVADEVQLQLIGPTIFQTLKSYTGNSAWTQEIIDLTPYKEYPDLQFRFAMTTDDFIPADGFYFDDFRIKDYNCCVPLDTMAIDTMEIDTMMIDTMEMDTMEMDTMEMDTMAMDTMAMDTVSSIDLLAVKDVVIYPNPSKNALFVNLNKWESASYQVKIYNSVGVLYYSAKHRQEQLRLNLNDWSSGLYFIQLSDGISIYNSSFVVEK